MFLNHPNDKDTKKNNFEDGDLYKEFPKLLDLTGQWAEEHETAYIGIINVIKKDGEKKIFHENIREQYIVKDMKDYYSLSSHLIDKKSMGDVWTYDDNYKII